MHPHTQCPNFNPQNLWIDYFIGITGALQRGFSLGFWDEQMILDFPIEVDVIRRSLKRGGTDVFEAEWEDGTGVERSEKGENATPLALIAEEGIMSQGMQAASRLWQRPGNNFPLALLEETGLQMPWFEPRYFDFSPVKLILYSWPIELQWLVSHCFVTASRGYQYTERILSILKVQCLPSARS